MLIEYWPSRWFHTSRTTDQPFFNMTTPHHIAHASLLSSCCGIMYQCLNGLQYHQIWTVSRTCRQSLAGRLDDVHLNFKTQIRFLPFWLRNGTESLSHTPSIRRRVDHLWHVQGGHTENWHELRDNLFILGLSPVGVLAVGGSCNGSTCGQWKKQ